MTTISPNYAGVNFKATEQVQPKKAAETNAQSKPESKRMSNAAKVGIGLGALATVAIAGLAIKKGLNKPISINTKQLFEDTFGKIDEVDKLEAGDLIESAKSMISVLNLKGTPVKHTCVTKLDEKGLGLLKKNTNVDISKDILGEKKAFLLQLCDKDAKVLESKPFFANTVDEVISNWFGKESVVKLG